MKKIMLGVALVAMFAACTSKKSDLDNANVVLVQDTFRMYNNSVLTDQSPYGDEYVAPAAPVRRTSAATSRRSTSSATRTSSSSNNNSGTVATAPAKKKGWSNRAKGAVIGAGAGAIGGAIINGRNRGAGAAIGAVIGAAGGYIIGNEKDKKSGQ